MSTTPPEVTAAREVLVSLVNDVAAMPFDPGPAVDAALAPLAQALTEARSNTELLATMGFTNPLHIEELRITIEDLQWRNPSRLRTLGALIGEFLVHGTTHNTVHPPGTPTR